MSVAEVLKLTLYSVAIKEGAKILKAQSKGMFVRLKAYRKRE